MFFNLNKQFIGRFMEWMFYGFICIFPFVFYDGWLFYGTASRSINLVVFTEILAIAFGIFLMKSKERISFIKSPITLGLLFLLISSFISSLNGVDFSMSFWSKATRMSGLFYFLHIGLFYLFLTMAFNEKVKMRRLIKVFVFSATVFSLGSFLSKDGLGLIFKDRFLNGFMFGNSSFAAMYLYAAFMLSIYLIYTAKRKINARTVFRFFLPIFFIINPYFLNKDLFFGKVNLLDNPLGFVGEAQASSFAMFFSIFFLFIVWIVSKFKKANIRKGFLWTFVIGGVIVLIFATNSFLSTSGYLRSWYLKQASNARPIVWELSKQSIKDRPILGWGVDNFDRSFEKNYDNSVLELRNGGEAWFDRAHNIWIDQTVETGYLGLISYILVYILIFTSMIYVIFKSKDKDTQSLAVIIVVYFVGHIMELQTGFDTTISYIAVIVMASLASIIFFNTYKDTLKDERKALMHLPNQSQFVVGIVLAAFSLVMFTIGTYPIIRSENTNAKIRTVGSSVKRVTMYPTLFGSPLDQASFLWRTSNDFQRGIAQKPKIIEDPVKTKELADELAVHISYYEKYAINHPKDYRLNISLANAYIYNKLLGVETLDKAHETLDKSIALYPHMPQAYWMKAVAYLYQGKFKLAREWAQKGLDLNPDVEQSQKIVNYIDRSIKTFPDINFFTFGQV